MNHLGSVFGECVKNCKIWHDFIHLHRSHAAYRQLTPITISTVLTTTMVTTPRRQCECKHGTGASGTECPVHGSAKCVSCDKLHWLGPDSKCHDLTDCDALGKQTARAGTPTANAQCGTAKVCRCSQGMGATSKNCPKHEAEKCASCRPKFYLDGIVCKAHTDCGEIGKVETKAGTGTTDAECGAAPGTSSSISFVFQASIDVEPLKNALTVTLNTHFGSTNLIKLEVTEAATTDRLTTTILTTTAAPATTAIPTTLKKLTDPSNPGGRRLAAPRRFKVKAFFTFKADGMSSVKDFVENGLKGKLKDICTTKAPCTVSDISVSSKQASKQSSSNVT